MSAAQRLEFLMASSAVAVAPRAALAAETVDEEGQVSVAIVASRCQVTIKEVQ